MIIANKKIKIRTYPGKITMLINKITIFTRKITVPMGKAPFFNWVSHSTIANLRCPTANHIPSWFVSRSNRTKRLFRIGLYLVA